MLGRDDDLQDGLDPQVAAAEGRLVGGEDDLVGLGGPADRLEAGRPEHAATDVAHVAELAPGLAGRVLAPAGHVQPPAGARARAGVGEQDVVLGVGEDVGPRHGVARRRQPAAHRRAGDRRDGTVGARRRPVLDDAAGAAVSTIGASVGTRSWSSSSMARTSRSAWNRRVITSASKRVGQRHQAHPLVMGHVGSDDDRALPLGQAVGRVVDRLVEAVFPLGAFLGQVPEVRQGLAGREHRGHGRRVRRDDPVLLETLLEPQARDTEGLVLVVAVEVLRGETRFGDPPG